MVCELSRNIAHCVFFKIIPPRHKTTSESKNPDKNQQNKNITQKGENGDTHKFKNSSPQNLYGYLDPQETLLIIIMFQGASCGPTITLICTY